MWLCFHESWYLCAVNLRCFHIWHTLFSRIMNACYDYEKKNGSKIMKKKFPTVFFLNYYSTFANIYIKILKRIKQNSKYKIVLVSIVKMDMIKWDDYKQLYISTKKKKLNTMQCWWAGGFLVSPCRAKLCDACSLDSQNWKHYSSQCFTPCRGWCCCLEPQEWGNFLNKLTI